MASTSSIINPENKNLNLKSDSNFENLNPIEENDEDAFYKKNPNSEEFFIVPLNTLKSDVLSLDEISCMECSNIAIKPLKCGDCKKTICKICSENNLRKKESKDSKDSEISGICSVTNNPHNFKDLTDEEKLNFDNLLISCPTNDSNCKEIILYKNLKDHLGICKYYKGTYSCLGCKKNDLLNEMECHVLTCDQIEWNCNFCNKPIKRATMGEHMEICEAKPVQCKKCKRSYRGEDIEKHSSKDECLYSVMIEMRNTFNGKFGFIFLKFLKFLEFFIL